MRLDGGGLTSQYSWSSFSIPTDDEFAFPAALEPFAFFDFGISLSRSESSSLVYARLPFPIAKTDSSDFTNEDAQYVC